MKKQQDIAFLRRALLERYDSSGRSLPWRVRPEDRAKGITADPYAVWLSEIMLQQTTVAHATPFWHKFLKEFPGLTDLANADRDRVLAMWAGLGYYSRARNLHKCAQILRDEHDGEFPQSEKELLRLPGIGPYTAATMAAICFNEATNIVDGNVERVISRMFKVEVPLPKSRAEIKRLAGTLADPDRPGDYGQALMDLGASLCSPRNPDCKVCPWSGHCEAFKAGVSPEYPKKIKKKKLPIRFGAVFVLRCGENVLLERRPDKGLLGGMMGLPGTQWGLQPETPMDSAPAKRNWQKSGETVRHIFTHFDLRLDVYAADIGEDHKLNGEWAELENIGNYALPTVMQKGLKAGLALLSDL